ncbi:MAG: hypothetical protein ACREL1_07265 [bacterium]
MNLKRLLIILSFGSFPAMVGAQQQDVPEPVFQTFSVEAPYALTFHGRDPFKALDNIDRSPELSISELNYGGVIQMGDSVLALFTWRENPMIHYTLKSGKLYGANDKVLDGVVGNITKDQVVLIQGDQKLAFSRK